MCACVDLRGAWPCTCVHYLPGNGEALRRLQRTTSCGLGALVVLQHNCVWNDKPPWEAVSNLNIWISGIGNPSLTFLYCQDLSNAKVSEQIPAEHLQVRIRPLPLHLWKRMVKMEIFVTFRDRWCCVVKWLVASAVGTWHRGVDEIRGHCAPRVHRQGGKLCKNSHSYISWPASTSLPCYLLRLKCYRVALKLAEESAGDSDVTGLLHR